jgi:hypothetical protein
VRAPIYSISSTTPTPLPSADHAYVVVGLEGVIGSGSFSDEPPKKSQDDNRRMIRLDIAITVRVLFVLMVFILSLFVVYAVHSGSERRVK